MFHAFVREADRLVRADIGAANPPAILWADIVHPTADDTAQVAALLGIDIPTLPEMQEIEPSARLYEEAGAQFMTVPIVVGLDGDAPRLAPVTFILGTASLVTVRHADAAPFEQVIARRLRINGGATAEALMLDLVDAIVDRVADVLERSALHCDAVSREVFARKAAGGGADGPPRDLEAMLGRIGREGDLLTQLRECLVGLARMLSYHGTRGRRDSGEARARLKTIQRDVQALTDHASFLSGKINFLLDATLGLINLEQNQIIKIFTVAAVAFLPPTLIASIYGMNFDAMPELRWQYGYPFAIGLMILSSILPFAYFRKRGWL
ncbi:MAG TPA: magnesium transporter CorA family protein [Sphingopyxis sp.]|nr:magnesium transporter CorA family protein [Sphingopyxis sp.]HKX89986.1 magnesium transporter CorA family protein [Sphingopyxis sp.]